MDRPFRPDDQASVAAWDAMNRAGQYLVANGGSDLHGVRNTGGFIAGSPTTVVHADALSKPAVLAALRAGRSFITRRPDGVELYLSGELPGQRSLPGGTLYGPPTERVGFEVLVRRAGMRLVVLRDGVPASTTAIESEEQVVAFSSPVGVGGFVRVEVRSAPTFLPDTPLASTLDMEALTNPICRGAARRGTCRGAHARRRRDAARHRAMTHSEALLRARGAGHRKGEVTLTGQATALEPGVAMLSRWAPGCCSRDAELVVRVRAVGLPDGLAVARLAGRDRAASGGGTAGRDVAPARRAAVPP